MGVPALFAYLQRKYPSIVRRAKEEKTVVNGLEIPPDTTGPNPNGVEYDNLYLDMNGIIHPCCHPEDQAEPETELDMMMSIYKYIDRIFALVRPRKLLYLAVDGPAPRAKMNQQRSRRFRAAMESDEKKKAIAFRRAELDRLGKSLPPPRKTKPFDSNVITPGTEFMERLAEYLEYYVLERLASDPAWKEVTVILSDAAVPGEGEHKIMDYIRMQRGAPGHDPNLRHVLYGADADLIMLGLASHEPYFTVLREEFRPTSKKPCDMCHHRGHKLQQCPGLPEGGVDDMTYGWGTERAKKGPKFLFIELNVLRDFLGRDLGHRSTTKTPTKESRQHVERMIDDWIFICFFVGNDFLPHLPSLRIREGAIDRLVEIYKKLPKEGGNASYIHTNGRINLRRLEFLFSELGKVEDKIFVDRHSKKTANTKKADKKRKAMDKFDKLTAQQQYERKHGKDQDEATLWMTALANEAQEQGIFNTDKRAANEAAAAAAAGLGDGKIASQPVQMPSWALSAMDELDPAKVAELQGGGGGTMSIRRELSAEAEEWLARKKARNDSKAKKPKSWEGKAGGAGGSAGGGGAGSASAEVADAEGYEDLTNLFEAGPDLAPPWAKVKAIPRPAELDTVGNGEADFDHDADDGSGGGSSAGSGAAAAGAGAGAAFANAVDEKAKGQGKKEDQVRLWEEGWKERYYLHKFQVNATDGDFKGELIKEYVKGLCWVLEYYFQGVPSWTWYFPYHYAPFASDCTRVAGLDITFDPGSKPFRPLEQLLAVFPPASAHLIPESFGKLMLDERSPIIENYPLEFETDLNGFKFAWQGVTLLPFVQEDALLQAASAAEANLDVAARGRNKIGETRLYIPSTHSLCETLVALPGRVGATSAGAGEEGKETKKSKKKGKKKKKSAAAGASSSAATAATLAEWTTLDPSASSLTLAGQVQISAARRHQLLPGQSYPAPKDSKLGEVACTAACVDYLDPPFAEGKGHTYVELPGTRWPTKGVGDWEKPCYDFANGKCKFGAKCRFSHTAPLPDRGPGAEGDDAKPCFDYAAGRCKFGKRCKFAHIGKPGQGSTTSTVYCRDLAAGNCKWGKKCFFSHDAAHAAASEAPETPDPTAAASNGGDGTRIKGGVGTAAAGTTAVKFASAPAAAPGATVSAFAAAGGGPQAPAVAAVSAFAAASSSAPAPAPALIAKAAAVGPIGPPPIGPPKKRKVWRSGGSLPFAKKTAAPTQQGGGSKKKKRKKSTSKK